ncbi:MAG TPA: CocE/NonD family hydrolase, partial [Myxococcales bacterium]|nr:CocE/NonD family hydrolase [Myxococcales bacterium]
FPTPFPTRFRTRFPTPFPTRFRTGAEPRRKTRLGGGLVAGLVAGLLLAFLGSGGCSVEYHEATFQVVEGVGEIRVVGAIADADARVLDAGGAEVARGTTDSAGRWAADVLPGRGYRVRVSGGGRRQESEPVDAFGLAAFDVRESVGQLHVTGADIGSTLEVRDGAGALVGEGTVDLLRTFIGRSLDAGGNTFRVIDREALVASADKQVMSVEDSLPDQSFYDNQVLEAGFNYITTRDGTTLSAFVSFPPGAGPHPTLVFYSGYDPSNVASGLAAVRLIGGPLGYATVGVNMRGTGCSGGAWDYFEPLQVLDGYDMVETIAAQDWVLHNHVGLAGLSYPGISQLFTAQTRPPHLAAAAPLSVIADTASSILAPGGIFNDGFAVEWAERVYDQAAPYGQGWEAAQVEIEAAEGVDTCAQNQIFHGRAVDPIARAFENDYYVPEIADPLNPSLFVGEIDVPILLSGAWQDEQTGPHFATLLDDFTGSPMTRFVVFNGLHVDGYSTDILAELIAFMDLYVKEQRPAPPPGYETIMLIASQAIFGQPLPALPIPYSDAGLYPDLAAAQAAYEGQKQLKVIFERGSDPARLGKPSDGFAMEFDAWPPPETVAWRLYLHEDGSLRETAPTAATDSASKFEHDPEAGQRTFGGGQPFYDWAQPAPGKALVFESEPLIEDHVLVGSASVDLWLGSTADDADLQVLVSEVSPDGNETFVQAGWLRASQRALAPDANELRPVKTHLEADAALLPPGEYALTRVEVMPFGQVFRAGSRVRLVISTPGDSRERWRFKLLEYPLGALVEHQVAHSMVHPSSVVLPLIRSAVVPVANRGFPVCPSRRGRPCRPHVAYSNAPGD